MIYLCDMKIKLSDLRKIIKEEVGHVLNEAYTPQEYVRSYMSSRYDVKSLDDLKKRLDDLVPYDDYTRKLVDMWKSVTEEEKKEMWQDEIAKRAGQKIVKPAGKIDEPPGPDPDAWRSSPSARYSRERKAAKKFYGPSGAKPRW